MHTKVAPDGRPARYKVYWGGRGAAKSWAIAEALIRMASTSCIRVLCVREIQNSIKDSSHKILKDTISRLGLNHFFVVTKNEIISRSGSEFIFKGLFNNEQGIRSTEGIDICWVEEAHSVGEDSWRALLPTVRRPGSEVWISFNMMNEDDPVYVRWVLNTRRGSIVHKVNFDANPYFWDSPLVDEMEDDKRLDQHMYEHVWLGMPLKIDGAVVLSGKYVEREIPPDLWKQADRLYFGADFGYAQDPAALVRMFVLGNTLYIDYEAYSTGIENDEYGEFYGRVPQADRWPVKADSSRPETISHIKNKFGYDISAAEKWEGCVWDGVAHLRGYDEIVIDPRCRNVLHECRMYRYKVDKKTKEVLPIIIDKHNHAIDAIRYGLDGVITRGGELAQWERLGADSDLQANLEDNLT